MTNAARGRAAVAVLAVCYAALWACAPIASGPPPAPMIEGRSHELGAALSFAETGFASSTSPLGGDCAQGIAAGCSGPSLAGWYRHERRRWDLTTQAFVGVPTLVGATGRLAYRAVDRDRFFVAPAVQAGWLTAGVSVPVGFAASERTWVVLTPSAQFSLASLVRGSAAVWHTGPRGAVVGVEVGVGSVPDTAPVVGDLSVLLGGQLRSRSAARRAEAAPPTDASPPTPPQETP